MLRKLSLLLVCVPAAACAGHSRSASSAPAEDSVPVLVAPGVISTDAPEFALTAMRNGSVYFFDRASADRRTLAIMSVAARPDGWGAPAVASFSGTYRDVDPFVAPGGSRLFFSSDRPRAGVAHGFHTWYVERTRTGWGAPIDPGAPLNSDSDDVFVSADRHGTLYFSSTRDGRRRIYSARPAGRSWTVPVAEPVDTAVVGNPAIAPSGRFILFTKPVPGRGADLFVSCRQGTGWATPVALPDPINTRYAEFAPYVDAAETTLFFTSERPGIVAALPDSVRPPGDIYRVALSRAGIPCR